MRAHLFEACEAAGWPTRQEKGWKGVIRTITYDSQTQIESALRREANGTMAAPGITSAHVQAAYKAQYGLPPEQEEIEQLIAEQQDAPVKEEKTKATK
jgi:hypothetical protein